MNSHNSNKDVSCESEFDSVSPPLAKKVDADVYVIDSDKQGKSAELERTVTRLYGISEESWDYSGVFYTNCFRANKPIMLTSLGFFGPAYREHAQGAATYVVDVLIEELQSSVTYDCATRMRFTVSTSGWEEKNMFFVNCAAPVSILANVWYAIKFQLQGPVTFRGVNQRDQVLSSDGITFDFFQGSLQMPVLKYIRHEALHTVVG